LSKIDKHCLLQGFKINTHIPYHFIKKLKKISIY